MNSQKETQKENPLKKNRLILVIASIFLILSVIFTFTGINLYRVLFNSSHVKELLFTEVKDTNLVPAVLEFLSEKRAAERVENEEALSGISEPDIPLLLSFMKLEDWRTIKGQLLDDNFIQHLVSVSVDGTYAWIDSNEPFPQIEWQLKPLKNALVGKSGKSVIMVGYQALPECTDEQIAEFTSRLAASPPGVEVLYNLCRFPVPWKEDQIDDYVHALEDVNNNIPEDFSFSNMLEENQSTSGTLLPLVKRFFKTIRWLGRWGWLTILVSLGLIIVFCSRSIIRILKWAGVPLIITGVLLLLLYFLAYNLINKWIVSLILTQTSEIVRLEVSASLNHLASEINKPLPLEILIVFIVGCGLLITQAILSKRKKSANKT